METREQNLHPPRAESSQTPSCTPHPSRALEPLRTRVGSIFVQFFSKPAWHNSSFRKAHWDMAGPRLVLDHSLMWCGLMTCKSCNSENQRRFNSEINVHLPGLKNLDKAPVLYFPSFWSVLTAVLQNLPFQRSHCFYLEDASRHPGPEHARDRVGFLTYRVSTLDCPSAVAKSKSANLLLTNRLP